MVAGRDTLRANPACEAPDDCFAVGTSDVDMAAITPYEVQGVGVAHSDTYGAIHMMGATNWKVDAGNDGDLVGDGTTIYSVGHQLGLDALEAPPQVRALDAKTGETRWITTLGTERSSLLSGYIVALKGGILVVATESQLFAVPVGAS